MLLCRKVILYIIYNYRLIILLTGKLLDEFNKILRIVQQKNVNSFRPIPYKNTALIELNDLVYMALEYGYEKFFPELKFKKKKLKAKRTGRLQKQLEKQNERIQILEKLVNQQSTKIAAMQSIVPIYVSLQ